MAASLPFTRSPEPEQYRPTSLSAQVVLGDARGSTTVDVDQVRLGRRGLVMRFPWALREGHHAWVEVLLPSGKKIRPLVSVIGQSDNSTSSPLRVSHASLLTQVRYVHLFPEHRRALDAYLASPSGY